MIKFHVYKAQEVGGIEVESMMIVIDEELSVRDYPENWMEETTIIYQIQARKLAKALVESLPGATFDQLLCEMLQIKASHFRVSFNTKGQNE